MLNGIIVSVLMPLSRGSLWFTRRIPPCRTCRVPQQHMAGRWWKRVRRRRSLLSPPTPITEALLRAIPMLGHKAERLHNIPGEPPNVALPLRRIARRHGPSLSWEKCPTPSTLRAAAPSIPAVPTSCPNVARLPRR
jgi:hypothetical protein